jgi:hypothetical protein
MAINKKLATIMQNLKHGTSQRDFLSYLFETLSTRMAPRYPLTISLVPVGNPVPQSHIEPQHLVLTLYWKDDTGRHLTVEMAIHAASVFATVTENDDRSWEFETGMRDLSEKPANEFWLYWYPDIRSYRKDREDGGRDMHDMVIYIRDILVRWRTTNAERLV